jgi:Uma2 family endonuclease
MGETETHINQLLDFLIHPLKERYRDNPDVYVVGNMFLYYEEGNPTAVVAPDAYVVFGIPKVVRRTYKLWEEGKAPDVIFELTSKKTYRADLTDKRFLYEELGVKEYFLFDPLNEYLRPPLQGFRLVDDYYMPLLPEQIAPGQWELESEQLGLILRAVDNDLRFFDPLAEQYLLARSEEGEARRLEEQRRRQEEQRRRQEEQRRRQAEVKLENAEAEILRLKRLLGEE